MQMSLPADVDAARLLDHLPCPVCGDDRSTRAWLVPPREARARALGLPGGRSSWVVCEGCGLVYQSPRASEAALAAMYSDGGYHQYQSGVPEHYVQYSMRRPLAALAWLDEMLPGVRGAALDVGCGVGGAMLELRRRGWQTTGVEPDPDLSELARTRFGLDVRTGFFDDHTFPNGERFDLVYTSHVWEHLSDPIRTTKAVRSVVADDGHFLIVVPTFRRARRLAWGTFSAAHNFMYSELTLGRVLRAAGFEVLAHRFAAGADSELWMLARAAAEPEAPAVGADLPRIQVQLATVPLRAPLGLPARLRTHVRTLAHDPQDFVRRLRRWSSGRVRRVRSKLGR